jgi:hypothetical protein
MHDPSKLICQKDQLCSTLQKLFECTTVCPIEIDPDDAQFAHTWSINNQHRYGIWGHRQNNDVHLLCKKCHYIVDRELRNKA